MEIIQTISLVMGALASLLTCLGVVLSAIQFKKLYGTKLKIKWELGTVGKVDENMQLVGEAFSLIVECVNHSMFDIDTTGVFMRFGKNGTMIAAPSNEPLKNKVIKARSNMVSCIGFNGNILNNFLVEEGVDSKEFVYVVVETPTKKYVKRTKYTIADLSYKYQCYEKQVLETSK